MTVDESAFRALCKDLEASYMRLGQLRDARPRPPEVRSALRPAPGPSAPGNGVAIYTLIDCETRLREVAFDALGDLGVKLKDGDARAFRLCSLMAFHAYDISRLEWAADLMDELRDQDRKLTKAIERIEPQDTGQPRPERRQTARSICHRLTTQGYDVSPDLIRKWAERGRISRKTMDDGKAGYLATEVLGHAARDNYDGEP